MLLIFEKTLERGPRVELETKWNMTITNDTFYPGLTGIEEKKAFVCCLYNISTLKTLGCAVEYIRLCSQFKYLLEEMCKYL